MEPSATSAARTAATAGPTGPVTTPEAAGALLAGPGLIHRQGAAAELFAVQSGDGRLRLGLARHLHKPEAARLAAELVLDDGGGAYLTKGREGLVQLRIGRRAR